MRFRITFSKTGPMRYVGLLDLQLGWERAFRRSGLPLAYSQGFHPQPRLNIASALPVGITSQCELLDAWLEQDFSPAQVHSAISTVMPPGLTVENVNVVDEHKPALQTQVIATVYRITFLENFPDLAERVNRVDAAQYLPRVRRGKSYDLRPLVEAMSFASQQNDVQQVLRVQLSAREGATGRPEELLDELGIKFEDTRIHREKLILISD